MLTASGDNTVRLWTASTGTAFPSCVGMRTSSFAEFIPDGKTIVTASWDGTARLWDTSSNKILVLRGHQHLVFYAALTPTEGLSSRPLRTKPHGCGTPSPARRLLPCAGTGAGSARRHSARTAAPSSPRLPTGLPGCGIEPPAGNRHPRGNLEQVFSAKFLPTAGRSSPPLMTRPHGFGKGRPGRKSPCWKATRNVDGSRFLTPTAGWSSPPPMTRPPGCEMQQLGRRSPCWRATRTD